MSATLPETRTADFVAALRGPQRPLEFWLHGQRLLPPGYHLTEIGAVQHEAVDCGGRASRWRETVVQLMDGTPAEAARGFMSTRKALAIWERVGRAIALDADAPLRFEYGNAHTPALRYRAERVEEHSGRVVVHLALPGVQCKAGDACGLPAGLVVAACEPGGTCC